MFKWLRRLFRRNSRSDITLGETLPWFHGTRVTNFNIGTTLRAFVGEEETEDKRVEIEPKALIQALESGVNVSLEDIDAKIKQLRERQEFWKNSLKRRAPVEIEHAIIMLEARKKYPKLEARIPWKTTTRERIDEICAKYKVEFRTIEDFTPELPPEAVREAAAFTAVLRLALADRPEFHAPALHIIAPSKMFKTRKGDPILLANSPFGEFYYVLCAWDKEVKFVEELLA